MNNNQTTAVTALEKKGFKFVNQWEVNGELCISMKKQVGSTTYEALVEEEGTVNGEPLNDYLTRDFN